MQSEAQNRKEGEEAALHSQAGNKEKEKQPEPGIYGGKNNSHPKIPQDPSPQINRNIITLIV